MDSLTRLKTIAEISKYGITDLEKFKADLLREAATRSLYEFIKQGWRYIDPSPFVDGWHIQAVCEHLEALAKGTLGARHLLINQPPRTMKSISVSVALCPWIWAQRGQGPGVDGVLYGHAVQPGSRPPHPPLSGAPSRGTGTLLGSHTPPTKKISTLMGPQARFLYASYGQHLSLRDSVKSRRLLSSPWYLENWKHFQIADDMNTKTRFDNSAGGYRIATSVGGALTGEGGDFVVFDDPHNTVDMESKISIENVIQWWDEAMSTRLNDPKTGAYIGVMQRLRQNDLSGHIISKDEGQWCHLMLPMEYEPRRHCVSTLGWQDPRGIDENGDLLEGLDMTATPPRVIPGTPMAEADGLLLCPDRFGPDEVLALKTALGPFSSAGQLQQNPVPEGGGIIKEAWWQMFPQKGEETIYTAVVSEWSEAEMAYVEREILNYPEMEYVIVYADTAYTEREENDYSAAAMLGVFRDKTDNPKIMLMKCWQERLELHKLVQKLATTCRLSKKTFVDKLVIENKASGKSVAQEIIRLFGTEKWSTQTSDPKGGDKVARAYSIQYIYADRMVFAPNRSWADLAITECSNFPKGEHDDLPDAIFGGIRWLRDNGYIEMRREREIAVEDAKMLRKQPGAMYDC